MGGTCEAWVSGQYTPTRTTPLTKRGQLLLAWVLLLSLLLLLGLYKYTLHRAYTHSVGRSTGGPQNIALLAPLLLPLPMLQVWEGHALAA